MIQFVKQETQWPGLYIVSLNQKMRKGKNIAYKQVAKLAKVVPITTGKEWLKRKSVSVITDVLTRYCNQREKALAGVSRFEDMDALALRTIRTKVLTQTDFNRLCKAIITHSLCLTRLTHSWSKYHKPTIWDTIIPELIEFAHNNQNA